MAADGSLVFDTKINVDSFKAALSALETAAYAAFKGISSNTSTVSDAMAAAASSASKVGEEISSSMVKAAETVQQSAKASSEAGKALEDLGKSADTAGAKTKTLGDEAKGAGDGAKKLGQESEEAGKEVKDLGEEAEKASETAKRSMEVLGGAADKVGKAVKVALAAAATSLVAAGGYALKVGSNFEAGMSQVAAVSGTTGSDLEALTEKAKEMGAKTKFSATESAEAFQYMAMAGWKTQDMLGGIEGIMNLAAASGENLASVSDIVTDAMTAFGLAASDSGHFADVLAAASSNANTNVGLMGATFKYVAPIAGAMGYSIEDTAVAIGLMANAGIKGEQAGTALRAMLTRLVKPPKDAAAALEELGISVKNSDGSMKPLRETLAALRESFSTLTDAEKSSTAASIAGQEAMSGLLAIVNASDADFEKLASAIDSADGAALRMAETMQDNLAGSMTILGSTAEGLGIRFYDAIGKTAKGAVDSLIKALSSSTFLRSFDKIAAAFSKLMEQAGKLAEKAIPAIAKGFAFLAENLGSITRAALTAYAAFKAFTILQTVTSMVKGMADAWKAATLVVQAHEAAQKLTQVASLGGLKAMQTAVALLTGKITLATAAQWAFNTAVNALGGPIGAAIAAAGALAAGLVVYIATAEKAVSPTQQLVNETEALIEKSRGLREELQQNAEQYEENDRGMEAEAGTARILAAQLAKLANQSGKTAVEKRKMAVIVGQLNELVPELNLALNEETGALNLTEDAINGVIQSSLQMAKAQAAQERLTAAAKDLAEAEMNHNDLLIKQEELTTALAEAKERYLQAIRDGLPASYEEQRNMALLQKELDGVTQEIGLSAESMQGLSDKCENWADYAAQSAIAASEDQASALKDVAQAADDTGESLEGLGEEASGVSARFSEAMAVAGMSAKDASEMIAESTKTASDAATNAFSTIEQNAALSVDQMIDNLLKNQAAVEQWGTNLKILAERGVDEGLISTLREAGPEMAAQTQALVDASDAELQRLTDVYRDNVTSAIKAGESSFEAELTAMGQTAQGVVEEFSRIPSDAEMYVSGTPDAVAGAIAGSAPVQAAGQQVDDTAAEYSRLGPEASAAVAANPPDIAGPLSGATEQGVAAAGQSMGTLPNALQGPAAAGAQVPGQELNAAVPETQAAADAHREAIVDTMGQVPAEMQTVLEPAKDTIATFAEDIKTTGSEGFQGLADTAKTHMEAVSTAVSEQTAAALKAIQDWMDEIKKEASQKVPRYVQEVEKQMKKLPGKLKPVGKDAIKGLWEGMKAEQEWLNRQMADLIDGAIKAAKDAAEIHSPSRRTAEEVGVPLAEGIAKGVEEKMPEVSAQINEWVAGLIEEFGEEALKNIGLTADAISERLGGIYDTVKDHATNAFSTIKEADALSVQDLIHNLEDNQRAIEDWADNLQRAADRGLDEGLLQKFREVGPEMNATLENIVNASDREFARLNAQCAASGETISYALGTIFESMEPGMREAIEKAIAEWQKMPQEAETAASGTGSGVASGISSGNSEVTAAAQGAVSGAAAEYGKLPEAARTAASGTNSALAGALSSGSGAVTAAAKSLVDNAVAELKGLSEQAATAGKDSAQALSEAVKTQLSASPPDLKTPMETAGKAAIDASATQFSQLAAKIAPHLETARRKINEWYFALRTDAEAQVPLFTAVVTSGLEALNASAAELLRQGYDNTRQWFHDQIAEAEARMPEFQRAVLSPLEELPDAFADIGRRMVEGLWDGMDAMRGWLEGQIQEFVDSMVEAAQEAADIHSPSRRMAQEVGKPMAQGVGTGFADASPGAERGMAQSIDALIASMEREVSAEAASYGQRAAAMQTYNSTANSSVQEGNIYITIQYTGDGSDVDMGRVARQLGRRIQAERRAKGGVSL